MKAVLPSAPLDLQVHVPIPDPLAITIKLVEACGHMGRSMVTNTGQNPTYAAYAELMHSTVRH
jgi:hypothetical protein